MPVSKSGVSISEFDTCIRELTNEDPLIRPFLCEGSPFGCEIFLVGINPGTPTPFWPHWRLPYGCYKSEWIENYLQLHGQYKRTRACIERLFQAIYPVRCLETNIYPGYSPDLKSLDPKDRTTKVFEYLLKTIQPKIIFVHGANGIKHLEKMVNRSLPPCEFIQVELFGVKTIVITGHHLSRGWSYSNVDSLGVQLRKRSQEINQ